MPRLFRITTPLNMSFATYCAPTPSNKNFCHSLGGKTYCGARSRFFRDLLEIFWPLPVPSRARVPPVGFGDINHGAAVDVAPGLIRQEFNTPCPLPALVPARCGCSYLVRVGLIWFDLVRFGRGCVKMRVPRPVPSWCRLVLIGGGLHPFITSPSAIPTCPRRSCCPRLSDRRPGGPGPGQCGRRL